MSNPLQKVADGWMNLITGIGSIAKSRATSITHQRDREATLDELAALYDSDALAYRVCAEVPKDMFRRGMAVTIEDNEDLSTAMTDRVQTLELGARFAEVISLQRCMGKAALLMMIDDGRDIAEEVNEAAIKAVRWVRPYDARAITVHELDEDPMSAEFGQAKLYKIETQKADGTVDDLYVHPDRVLWFDTTGIATDPAHDECVSVLSRAYKPVRDWGYAWASTVELLDQAAIPVWKIGHLRQMVASEGAQVLDTRFGIANLAKSVARAVILDKDNEEFEWRQLQLGGLPETLDRIEKRVCAATGYPVTKLFGQSPGGLSTDDQSGTRNYYDGVEAERAQYAVPKLERLIRLLFLEKEGVSQAEPDVWSVEFPPLWQPTESELRTQELQAAQMLVGLANGGIILDEEARTAIGPNGVIRSIELDDGLYTEWLENKPEPPTFPPPEEDPEDESPEEPEQ